MSRLLRSYTTGVWLFLVALTGFSWWLSTPGDLQPGPGPSLATAAMFLVGFVKVRLVGMHFMELRQAPLPLRLLFELWAAGACVAIVSLYWLS